jgi:hypothetical protein
LTPRCRSDRKAARINAWPPRSELQAAAQTPGSEGDARRLRSVSDGDTDVMIILLAGNSDSATDAMQQIGSRRQRPNYTKV